MVKQGLKAQSRLFSAMIWGLSVLMAASAAAAEGPAHDQLSDARENPTLTVRAYTYAPILPKELAAAKDVAARIFEKVGVQLRWVDCPMMGSDPAQVGPPCSVHETPMEIHLSIMRDYPKVQQLDRFAMGFALTTTVPGRGQIASVSYQRAMQQLRDAEELSVGELLGLGMAHELGHLLLGSDRHSRTGVMRPVWTHNDLKLALLLQCTFTDEQAARIRLDMRARMEAQAAWQNPQLSSEVKGMLAAR